MIYRNLAGQILAVGWKAAAAAPGAAGRTGIDIPGYLLDIGGYPPYDGYTELANIIKRIVFDVNRWR